MVLKSKIGLGSVQFGIPYGISNTEGQTLPEEVSRILNFAAARNIRTLDTASAYGNAEEVLGKNDLSDFQVVSKYISPANGNSLEQQFNKSLSDLRISSLYGYLSHRPLELLNAPQQWELLQNLKQRQLISKIGFSLNQPSELYRLLDNGLMPDIIQVPYNYLDNRFESSMKTLKEQGCEIHTRSAFLQGLFFRDPKTLPDFFDQVKPMITEIQLLGASLPGALLSYVLQKSFIDKVIIGVENLAQLKQNVAAITIERSLPPMDKVINENILMPSYWPKK